MSKDCTKCARRKTLDCDAYKCNPKGMFNREKQWGLFFNAKDDPKKYCSYCGEKLIRRPSKKYSKKYREIPVKCPVHGIIGYIHEELRLKSKKDVMSMTT